MQEAYVNGFDRDHTSKERVGFSDRNNWSKNGMTGLRLETGQIFIINGPSSTFWIKGRLVFTGRIPTATA